MLGGPLSRGGQSSASASIGRARRGRCRCVVSSDGLRPGEASSSFLCWSGAWPRGSTRYAFGRSGNLAFGGGATRCGSVEASATPCEPLIRSGTSSGKVESTGLRGATRGALGDQDTASGRTGGTEADPPSAGLSAREGGLVVLWSPSLISAVRVSRAGLSSEATQSNGKGSSAG